MCEYRGKKAPQIGQKRQTNVVRRMRRKVEQMVTLREFVEATETMDFNTRHKSPNLQEERELFPPQQRHGESCFRFFAKTEWGPTIFDSHIHIRCSPKKNAQKKQAPCFCNFLSGIAIEYIRNLTPN